MQVRAAIKKKVEKQRRRTGEPALGSADIQVAPYQPHRQHKAGPNSKPPPPSPPSAPSAASDTEDQKSLEETLEEMMQGPQRREKEAAGAEPVDLLPIVDSVFGQVGAAARRAVCVHVCVHANLKLISSQQVRVQKLTGCHETDLWDDLPNCWMQNLPVAAANRQNKQIAELLKTFSNDDYKNDNNLVTNL